MLNAIMSVSHVQSQNQFTSRLAEDVTPSCQVPVPILKQKLSKIPFKVTWILYMYCKKMFLNSEQKSNIIYSLYKNPTCKITR